MKVCMFPGQGSQRTGMGKHLFDKYPEYVRIADEILGYSVEELCLNPQKEHYLNRTEYTQPALYMVNALSYMDFLESNDLPEYIIGHSLGEYNALLAAGIIDYETGLYLVQKRGELMGKVRGGGMLAVLNMPLSSIREILRNNNLTQIDIANINSKTEIIISGPEYELTRSANVFEKLGAYIVKLNVSGPFHSRYMKVILEEYKKVLETISFVEGNIPVVSNCNVNKYTKYNTLENLLLQIINPVQWVDEIEYLKMKGCNTFIQVGPGRVLNKLCNNILNSSLQ
ncbi:ACP S-malonyltransferase [Blautia producta]|uniref:ACP S-malonyltransferase n=1 Tax=Blautia producta TaxID=33035 RepID=UPI002109C2F7|nr:ACP S-malonyltransferase [Blautia producta]MCQ4746055.1 ACP S-malonyltransferase [Blautia producta]